MMLFQSVTFLFLSILCAGAEIQGDFLREAFHDSLEMDDESFWTRGLHDISISMSMPTSTTPEFSENLVYFQRIASFPVCRQIDPTCNTDEVTVSEIVTGSEDGSLLIYTDSEQNQVGFVDISDPENPQAFGTLPMGGEPTSVSNKGPYALVAVNTSPDFVNPSGILVVVDIANQSIVRTIDLGGQPDSIAVSPNRKYAAVAIENERDEDLGDGRPPQAPPGYLVVIDIVADDPNEWSTTNVPLLGLDGTLYPTDPEPEFVAINEDNVAVVTLQENNAFVLVDLEQAKVLESYSTGVADLYNIDIEDNSLIQQSSNFDDMYRESDGVTWLDSRYFVTADEGDLDGGTRGFTIFDSQNEGGVIYTSGNELELLAAKVGHYPEARSDKRGNEPETTLYATFGENQYLFVNSERASLVFVYDVKDPTSPLLVQVLPTGFRPEGALAIPDRDLFVTASEEDDREANFRSVISIYKHGYIEPSYPTLESRTDENGVPIPWGAMSGLAASAETTLYAVHDSFYRSSRIYELNTETYPAVIERDIVLIDDRGKLAEMPLFGEYNETKHAALFNDDGTVNLDLEGIAISKDGGFWVVSEGAGTVGDEESPVISWNLLLKISDSGSIENVYPLPNGLSSFQSRFGLKGVAEDGSTVVVAFQRPWGSGAEENPRLGIFDTETGNWYFLFYPVDAPESQNGGWVGVGDIASLGNMNFLVMERDNQAGLDAAIKRLYKIDISDVEWGATVPKTPVRDLLPDLKKANGLVPEKIEGLAVTPEGNVWIINNNDGVDDNNGETQLINLGKIVG